MSIASMFEINNLIQGWRQIASMQCSPSHSSQAGLSEACEPVTNKLLCLTLTQPTSHSALHNHEKLGGGWEHWPDAWTCTRLVAALEFKAYFLWWGTDPSTYEWQFLCTLREFALQTSTNCLPSSDQLFRWTSPSLVTYSAHESGHRHCLLSLS